MSYMVTRFRSMLLASIFLLTVLAAPFQASATPSAGGHHDGLQSETEHHHEVAKHDHESDSSHCDSESDCSSSSCNDCPHCVMCLNLLISHSELFDMATSHQTYLSNSFSTTSLRLTALFKPPRV